MKIILLVIILVIINFIFIFNFKKEDFNNSIDYIHSQLNFKYGNIKDELPEQIMILENLNRNNKVLEIGGNIGRSSLIIGYILGINGNNHVVLESDGDIYKQLVVYKDINNMKFKVENSALSKRKLIQKGWNTIPSDILLDGYKEVPTITYEELMKKYNIKFDTLFLDCEGAFYYILQDMPEILNGINLIIIENDYNDINHKIYIDDILTKNNFKVTYTKGGGWGPCKDNFFEVWKK